jgi:uncharacterized protein (TIGR02246 family)
VSTTSPTLIDQTGVTTLYQNLLNAWNDRNAANFAALFTPDGSSVGYDGSQMNGNAEIESTLAKIFADHPTAAYIHIVRQVRFLSPDTALLHAVVGMIPPGQSDINPDRNAVQSMVAVKAQNQWRIAHFHNTPAQFHGRPDLSASLTEELRQHLSS